MYKEKTMANSSYLYMPISASDYFVRRY